MDTKNTVQSSSSLFRAILGGVLVLLVTACASTASQKAVTSRSSDGALLRLNSLDQWVGQYSSLGELSMTLERIESNSLASRQYRLVQTHSDDSSHRRSFRLVFDATDETLTSAIEVGGLAGSETKSCPMTWVILDSEGAPVLLGQTDTRSCTFTNGDTTLALKKEVAFSGDTLQIADQVINSSTGQAYIPATITRFFRVSQYTGWAGRLEGDQWRITDKVQALSDGQRRGLSDAASMPLGISISLQQRELQGQRLLLLSVSDPDSGRVIGQAWATPDSRQLGWANTEVQVSLTRQP